MTKALALAGVDLANSTAIALYYSQHAIPQRFDAGIIVASIAVSLLGSYSALFVLGKRTGNSGVRNIALLVLAATVMSYVGIWSMHFIGMHMQLEATPSMKWYITYNPGFTVFSVLAPTFALIVSFLFVDNATFGFRLWKVVLAGTLTGGTVALMHYSASFHCNFLVSFKAAQVVVSILLACTLCTVGLTAFFRFRAQWQDAWWKRGICAVVLAAGVATMHYVAVSGTSYRMRPEFIEHIEDLSGGEKRNNIMVIIIAVTSFVVVVGSVFTALIEMVSTRESRKKARKLVVASATFDRAGRLMVQSDGTLPLITIEEKVLRRSQVMDALDQRSSIFQWLYAVSWKWDLIVPFLEEINRRVIQMEKRNYQADQRATLTRSQKARRVLSSRPTFGQALMTQHQQDDHLLDLRDKIINASQRLAEDLEVPLNELGIFYDRVLATGTKSAVEAAAEKEAYRSRLDASFPSSHHHSADRNNVDEASIGVKTTSVFGEGADEKEGATLFVVREVSSDALIQLSKKGFRFTETRFLSNVLADRHAVVKKEMESTLESLQVYAKRGTRPVVQPNGVYVGLFGVRPNSSHQNGGLDVLVYKFARHQVPAYRLPSVARLNSEMIAFLRLIDQMTMSNVSKVCEQEWRKLAEERAAEMEEFTSLSKAAQVEEELMNFYCALMVALEALQKSITFYPESVNTARISCDILEVPSSLVEELDPAQMILIQAVLPLETIPRRHSNVQHLLTSKGTAGTPFVFTPYTLFAKSQMMMLQGPTAEAFAKEVIDDLTFRELDSHHRVGSGKRRRTNTEEDGRLSDIISEKSDSKPNTPFEGLESKRSHNNKPMLRFPMMPTKHFNLSPMPRARTSSVARSETSTVSPSTATLNEKVAIKSVSSSSTTSLPSPQGGVFATLASLPKESLGIGHFIAKGVNVDKVVIIDQARFARPIGEQDPPSSPDDEEVHLKEEEEIVTEKQSKGLYIDTSSKITASSIRNEQKKIVTPSPKTPTRSSSKSEEDAFGRYRANQYSSSSKVNEMRRPSTATTSVSGSSSSKSKSRAVEFKKPDNWQCRQLQELEKYQPNLLLGIFPSEY